MLKLHKRFPLGNTGLALRVVYDCPLEELDHALEPPARLLVRFVPAPAQLSPGTCPAESRSCCVCVHACVRACVTIKIVVQRMPHTVRCSEDEPSWSLLARLVDLLPLYAPVFHCIHSVVSLRCCLKYEVVHQLVV